MDSKKKSNLWKKSESLFANSAPVFLSLAAIAGAATLAMFEYFGLVTDSMNSWYKFGLGLGVTVICIAYLYIARGKWYSAIPLSIIFGLYIFGGSFSGRSAITAETEKHAQFKATQAAETNNLKSRINEAIDLVIDHKTIKDNNELFATANTVINSKSDAPPLTINERRGDAVALLSRLNIHITAHEYEMLLTALFTLCLFIGTGTLSRAANKRTNRTYAGSSMSEQDADKGGQNKKAEPVTPLTDGQIKGAIMDFVTKGKARKLEKATRQNVLDACNWRWGRAIKATKADTFIEFMDEKISEYSNVSWLDKFKRKRA